MRKINCISQFSKRRKNLEIKNFENHLLIKKKNEHNQRNIKVNKEILQTEPNPEGTGKTIQKNQFTQDSKNFSCRDSHFLFLIFKELRNIKDFCPHTQSAYRFHQPSRKKTFDKRNRMQPEIVIFVHERKSDEENQRKKH